MRRVSPLAAVVLPLIVLALSATPASPASADGGGGSAPVIRCIDNGVCTAPTEDCTCTDCKGLASCVPGQCVADGVCDLRDACTCADCAADAFCADPAHCKADGVCDQASEGCQCGDCASLPVCLNASGASSGGTGGGVTTLPVPEETSSACTFAPATAGTPAALGLAVAAAFAAFAARRGRKGLATPSR